MSHKHVELTNKRVAHLDDDGNPVIATEKAVMDVPETDLAAFVADAQLRWQRVEIHDDCPAHCVAQMTVHPDEREAKLAKAAKLREKA